MKCRPCWCSKWQVRWAAPQHQHVVANGRYGLSFILARWHELFVFLHTQIELTAKPTEPTIKSAKATFTALPKFGRCKGFDKTVPRDSHRIPETAIAPEILRTLAAAS